MADDSNKVTLELDLDSGQFIAKMGEASNAFGGLKNEGEDSFRSLGEAALFLNQGIDLASKALEIFEAGMKQIEKAEVLTNQETAFKNLTASIGVSSATLLDAIKTATGGTVSQVDAISLSMKLLSSGMKAEQIPAFLELAHNTAIARGNINDFKGIVDATANSLTRGATRGMSEYGIMADVTGSKTAVLNTVMKQLQMQVDRTGTQFDDFSEKLAAKSTNTWNTVTKAVGGLLSTMLRPMVGDEQDVARGNLQKLNEELAKIQANMAKGNDTIIVQKNNMPTLINAQEAYKDVLAQIAVQNEILNKSEDAKKDKLAASTTELEKGHAVITALDLAERARVQTNADVIAAQRRVADESVTDANVQKAAYDDLYKAKVAQIEKDINDRKQEMVSQATDATKLTNQLVELEEEKYRRIRTIRITADQIKAADDAAEVSYVKNNLMTMDDAVKRSIQVQNNAETLRFTQQKQLLANSGLTYQQYLKAIEAETTTHEANVLRIKQSYYDVSERNLKLGINQSISQMKVQYTDFTSLVGTATKNTQKIMSNAFVEMAKGHGDAMQLMTSQFLESIGTQMVESGTFHLLAGIASFDPVEAAAGVGLIAAGSALVGAGAANAPSSSASSSSSSSSSSVSSQSSSPTAASSAAPAQPVAQASIVIQGDFLNSRETANHLQEIIRQNSDITDYSITAQGQNYGGQ